MGWTAGRLPLADTKNFMLQLGLAPIISGFVLVEIAALAVPSWNALRTGGPEDRTCLHRAAIILGLCLAVTQAFVADAAMRHFESVPAAGSFVRIVIMVGGTLFLLALAVLVDREGLGVGMCVVLLGISVSNYGSTVGTMLEAARTGALSWSTVGVVFGMTAASVILLLLLYGKVPLPGGVRYRWTNRLYRPVCGVVPIASTAFLVAFHLGMERARGNRPWIDGPAGVPAVWLVGLSVMMGVAWAGAFHRPDRMAAVWRSLVPNASVGPVRLVPELAPSLLFIAVLTFLHFKAQLVLGMEGRVYESIPLQVVLITGILVDLVEEVRVRQRSPAGLVVWEIHQCYAVEPALRMLAAHGIEASAVGIRVRALFHFFGPYAPIRVLVPAELAARARQLLEHHWPGGNRTALVHDPNPAGSDPGKPFDPSLN